MTEEMKQNDATRYFIVVFGDRYELLPTPFDNEGDARKALEAEALANPKVKFGLFQKIGTGFADLEVTWKGAAG